MPKASQVQLERNTRPVCECARVCVVCVLVDGGPFFSNQHSNSLGEAVELLLPTLNEASARCS